MESLVSVIVPCYNQAQYLPDALGSVLGQTYANWECIIVNDGSQDNTEEVAMEWVAKDKRFKYKKKENGGLSDARNFGIKHSNGIYVLPLDADDKISEIYLEEAVQILNRNYDVNVVYCEAEYFGNKRGIWKLPKFSRNELLLRNSVFCSALFRREDYLKTSGYNINMIYGWEDWDFWLSLLELDCTFYQLPKTHFYYRVRDNSMVKSLNEDKKRFLYNQMFLNHIDLYTKIFGSPVEAYRNLNNTLNSKDYRLGRMILNPFRKS